MEKVKIGVMGSAQGPTIGQSTSVILAKTLGEWIAKLDCVLITGACPGLPNEAALGARGAGGYVIGVSPAFSEKEHKESYRSPLIGYDVILYTGEGLLERDIMNIRASDAIIVVGGGVGTLNEFTIAYDEGKLIGVLEGTGGIADHIPRILEICDRGQDGRVIIEKDPKQLVSKILMALKEYNQPTIEDEMVKGKV